MNRHHSRLFVACFATITLTWLGCNPAQPAESEIDVEGIRVTLLQLEDQLNLAVDALQCGLPEVGEGEPTFVSNGFVVGTGDELRDMCVELVEPRTGAVWDIDSRTVNVLSNDIAYVVREGTYTVNFKDREPQIADPVITTIWQRENGEWKMVHLHESSAEIF